MATELLLLLFAISAPTLVALILSGKAKERRAWWLSLCAIGAVVINILALGIGSGLMQPLSSFVGSELSWNWSGKIIAIAFPFQKLRESRRVCCEDCSKELIGAYSQFNNKNLCPECLDVRKR
mgnify:CR=1 FL=1